MERLLPGFVRWVESRALGDDTDSNPPVTSRAQHRAIVVGYGPVGQTVALLLRENAIQPTIVDLNVETIQRLRPDGIPAVYGDANRIDTLTQAGVATAQALVLSASSVRDGKEIVRQARELNPRIRVLARTAYVKEIQELRSAGADAVFSGEGEVASAMTEAS